MKVAILGAGIAGLMTGNLLYKKGYDITIFEKYPQAGGLCRTRKLSNDFLFDVGGGHIFHSVHKDILDFIISFLGEDNLYKHKRNTKIFMHDKFIKYPIENGLADLPSDIRYECLIGFINASVNRNGKSYSNFGELIYDYFGDGLCKHFMVPYNRKIWCTDPSNMSVDWIENRIPHAPVRDVVKSALGIQTEGYKHQSSFYYPKHGGVQTFIDAVAEPVENKIRLNTPVSKISRNGSDWVINGESFDRVVSTIPLDEFGKISDFIPQDIKDQFNRLKYISLCSVLICLKKESTLPYSWVYLPYENQSEANRITFFSNYSDNLCPAGHSSILCEATYPATDTEGASELRVATIVDSIADLGMFNRSDIVGVYSEWNKYAYILHDLNMSSARDAILSGLNYDNLDFAGRFGSYRYYNVDQVIKQVVEMVNKRF